MPPPQPRSKNQCSNLSKMQHQVSEKQILDKIQMCMMPHICECWFEKQNKNKTPKSHNRRPWDLSTLWIWNATLWIWNGAPGFNSQNLIEDMLWRKALLHRSPWKKLREEEKLSLHHDIIHFMIFNLKNFVHLWQLKAVSICKLLNNVNFKLIEHYESF